MATKLIAPRPGEGVEELTIVSWFKQVGDHVDEFESVVELETDKVVTEFPSPISGTLLRIDVAAGDSVRVGDSMGVVGEPGESLDESRKSQPQPLKPKRLLSKKLNWRNQLRLKNHPPIQPSFHPLSAKCWTSTTWIPKAFRALVPEVGSPNKMLKHI